MKTERLFSTPLTPTQEANSALNLREFREGKTRLASAPRRIVFELTNRCNFQCVMCGREAAAFKGNDLPVEVIKSCEPFFTSTEEVTLHGWGEGTLHPRLGEILAYLNTFPRLRKYFVTNGSTLPRIMGLIFEHRVDLVAISLDGARPETNDSIRKGGNFLRETASVRRLLEEKKRRGAEYPYVNFVFTMMARNIRELPELVKLASVLGVPEVKAVYLTIFNDTLAGESLNNRQALVRECFAEASEEAARAGVNLKLPEVQGEGEAGCKPHKTCPFPWRDLYIGSDGFIRPCQSSAEKLTSIRDWGSFAELWNSPPLERMRATVNDPASMPRGCANCYHSSTANWNLEASFLQLGNTFAPEWVSATPQTAANEAPVETKS